MPTPRPRSERHAELEEKVRRLAREQCEEYVPALRDARLLFGKLDRIAADLESTPEAAETRKVIVAASLVIHAEIKAIDSIALLRRLKKPAAVPLVVDNDPLGVDLDDDPEQNP